MLGVHTRLHAALDSQSHQPILKLKTVLVQAGRENKSDGNHSDLYVIVLQPVTGELATHATWRDVSGQLKRTNMRGG